jgi:hypothetical protein
MISAESVEHPRVCTESKEDIHFLKLQLQNAVKDDICAKFKDANSASSEEMSAVQQQVDMVRGFWFQHTLRNRT